MPEGPEIRRAADRVAAAIEGRRAEDVFFAFERLKRFEEVLSGQVVDEVTTRGKAMLTRFADGLSVYSRAYRTRGVTLPDARYAALRKNGV